MILYNILYNNFHNLLNIYYFYLLIFIQKFFLIKILNK